MTTKQELFEAIDWGIFSLGGIVAAFLLPVNIFATFFLQRVVPTGLLASFQALTNLYLFLLLGVVSWHAIHRIRFVFLASGLSHYRTAVTALAMVVLASILVWAFDVIFLL